MRKLLLISAVVAVTVLLASSRAFAWGCGYGYGYAPRYYGYSYAPRYYGYSYYAPRWRFYGPRVGFRRLGWGGGRGWRRW